MASARPASSSATLSQKLRTWVETAHLLGLPAGARQLGKASDYELDSFSIAVRQSPSRQRRCLAHLRAGHIMKFEQSLLFNAVQDWQSSYIAYDQLKSAIYKIEKDQLHELPTSADVENARLLAGSHDRSAAAQLFVRLLGQELSKIETFYAEKERELLGEVDSLLSEADRVEADEEAYLPHAFQDDDASDDDSVDSGPTSRAATSTAPASSRRVNKFAKDIRSLFTTPSQEKKPSLGRKRRDSSADVFVSGRASTSTGRPRGLSSASKDTDLIDVGDIEPDQAHTRSDTQVESVVTAPRPSLSGRLSSVRRPRRYSIVTDRTSQAGLPDLAMVWLSNTDFAIDTRITFKLRTQALYRELWQLKQYAALNATGFRKITKKFDKVTENNLKEEYLKSVVEKAVPMTQDAKDRLNTALDSLVQLYAKITSRGDIEVATKQLRTQLREHVVFERNTIWREMIGLERKGWSRSRNVDKPILQNLGHEDSKQSVLTTPVGRFRIPFWLTTRFVGGAVGILLFVFCLASDFFDRPEEGNCLALLVLCTVFWALEVVPLFVTSLMVPFWVVVLRVLRSTDGSDERLSASDATKFIFSQMFNSTIMLLLGGFTLAAAFSKTNVDKVLATRVLRAAGTRPSIILLAYMGVACFASMWISNVAAPVLCFSLIEPILRTLPSHSRFSKALIIGIALSANIGGQSSPISSPQNLIALEYMDPPLSWLQWFAVSIPVSGISIVCVWTLLLWSYRWEKNIVINPVKASRDPFNMTQWFVCIVALVTIALWCVAHQVSGVLGDMGVIALIPPVLFFGSGVLRKADWDNLAWSIVFLAMGGIALGKAVLSSGLLADVDELLQGWVQGLDLWPILAIFSIICLIVATCISHTIAAVLIVPIAAQIGSALEMPHPRLLIMATALICSAGMGLPVSGFPNMTAINLEDEVGTRYLSANDFLKNGVPASVIVTTVVITLGYGIMRALSL
ncbi:uncharacterized protein L969DRAFT_96586 [Mixia osmundae IAM 14324]|uniref:SPX domain-containing protein n=1 Tax=Mixia osmundae (strain CBS 9802 / IAM 14324 / JCM 22182 / KY 12970) TaxID=764103 RepID=G7EAV9_MIXOS|nr:uncharacterized protein L969DRAFT_96586 [Mixia osmundae IAM 14324]KEI37003.1 hypothetical protein L969DRAFT_96586 [Mixia osmundae IAM 14324]GAA99969.1 hypothetical protein E5Q_06672 [Mixia osmundae IAM 14324]